jgi:hypothetical protein
MNSWEGREEQILARQGRPSFLPMAGKFAGWMQRGSPCKFNRSGFTFASGADDSGGGLL